MHMPGSCSVAASHVGSAMLGRPVCMTGVAGICARGAVALKRQRPIPQRPACVQAPFEQPVCSRLQEEAPYLMSSNALWTSNAALNTKGNCLCT